MSLNNVIKNNGKLTAEAKGGVAIGVNKLIEESKSSIPEAPNDFVVPGVGTILEPNGSQGGNYGYRLFQDNDEHYTPAGTSVYGTWSIGMDYDTPRKITKYSIRNSPDYPYLAPSTWVIEGSNDNTNWDILDTGATGWNSTYQTKEYTIANPGVYKQIRFRNTAGGSSPLMLSLIKFYENSFTYSSVKNITSKFNFKNIASSTVADVLVTTEVIVDGDILVIVKDDESIHEVVASGVTGTGPYSMDTTTTTTGEIPDKVFKVDEKVFFSDAEAIKSNDTFTFLPTIYEEIPDNHTGATETSGTATSSGAKETNPAWYAFSRDAVTKGGWLSNTPMPVSLEYQTPAVQTLKGIIIHAAHPGNADTINNLPTTFDIQYSLTGDSWVTIQSHVDEVPALVSEYYITENHSHGFFRILIHETSNGTDGLVNIGRIEFLRAIPDEVGLSTTRVHEDTLLPGGVETKVEFSALGNELVSLKGDVYIIPKTDDVTVPVITLLGSPSITIVEDSTYTDPGATGLDAVDGDVTSRIVVDNPVDESRPGTYTITYNLKDLTHNKAIEVTRTVIIAPLAEEVIGAVTNFTASQNEEEQITLTWDDPTIGTAPFTFNVLENGVEIASDVTSPYIVLERNETFDYSIVAISANATVTSGVVSGTGIVGGNYDSELLYNETNIATEF